MATTDPADALERAIARRRAASAAVAGMSPQQQGRVGELASRYGLGMLAVPLSRAQADDATALRVAEAKVRSDKARAKIGKETSGGFASKLWGDAVGFTKSVTRYAAAGTMFIPEYAQALGRGVAAEAGIGSGEGLDGIGATLRQTTVGAGIAEAKERGTLLKPTKWDDLAGDSWFIHRNTRTGKRQAREARASQLVEGEDGKVHAGTIGRNVAGLLPIEPGHLPYNIVSGSLDASVQFLGPGPKAGGRGSMAAGQTRNVQDAGRLVDVELPVREFAVTRPGREGGVTAPATAKADGTFHGTSAKFDSLRSVDDLNGHNNLYGPGFYTTESRDIAQEYTKKGSHTYPSMRAMNQAMAELTASGKDPSKMALPDIYKVAAKYEPQPAVMGVKWLGDKPPRLLNLDKTAPRALRDNSLLRETARGTEHSPANPALARLLDDPKATGAAIYAGFRNALSEQGAMADDADRLLHELRTDLMDEGFDGFTHRGGHAVGAGYNHKVSIYFDTAKIQTAEHVREPFVVANAIAEEVGLVDGIRKTVLPERFAGWLNADDGGNRVAQAIADIKPDDPMAFNTIRRATGKKLPADLIVRLVDATDPIDVKNILVDSVQQGMVRETVGFKTKKAPSRIASMMPATKIDLDDTDDIVEQGDRFMRNIRMPEAEISARNLAHARAATKGERYSLVAELLDTVRTGLVRTGFTPNEADSYVRMFGDAREGNRLYGVDLIADDATVRSVRLGNTDIELDGPHRIVQLIDRYLPLPDARELKKAHRSMEWVRNLQTGTGYKLSADFLDYFTQDLFKPLALVTRPAYPIRVVGEEQLRMAAAGFASMFRHPISYLSIVAADRPTVTVKGIDTATGKEVSEEVPSLLFEWFKKHRDAPAFGTDATGKRFDDEDLVSGVSQWRQAMSADSGGWVDRVQGSSPRNYVPLRPHNPEFADGWLRHELIELASDPIGQNLARHGAKHVKDEFWDGKLQGFRKELGQSLKDTKGRPINFEDRTISDAYVDMMAKEVRKYTLNHPDLIGAVAHGKLRGHPLTDGVTPNRFALKELQSMVAEGTTPRVVRGSVVDGGSASNGQKVIKHWENAVQEGFRLMMGVPTNRLSRSPVFRQAYWQRMNELVPLLTKADRARLIRNAKVAGVDRKIIESMRTRAAENADRSGSLLLENADTVAKHHGLMTTRDLLYSLHEKAQVADALRVVFPFGEAWREVLTRWTKLSTENPNVAYRGLQAIPAAERGGLIYPDPATGQEMFAIPGSEWVTEKLVGVPMKAEASVQGLSMFGTVLPGVGPAVTIPLSKVMPDHPTFDLVRALVLPFGDPDTSGGLFESLFPAYSKRLLAAAGQGSPRSQRQMASTVRDVMAYLHSTGDYDLSTPEGQQELLDDSKEKARALYIIRGIAQSTAPSAPVTKFYAKDKSGNLALLYELQADYRKMMAQNFDTATERFIDKWGENAFLATIPKTTGSLYSITDRVSQFSRAHPDQAKRFPATIGLFAPSGVDAPIGDGETERQIQKGVRDIVTPEDAIKTHNIRMASLLYDRAKEKIGDDPLALWAVQDKLVKKYPGFTGTAGDLSKGPGSVQELIRASQDPTLAATDAGKGLTLYLEARAEAQADARALGVKDFTTAARAEPLREWLDEVATWVLDQHPEFVDMWDRVLSREIEEAA